MKKSLFILLAFAMLISGCSTVSLVYRNLDWYLVHKINDYTSFNDRQQETIRREVSDYMLWHHKYALPEYIIFLQNLNGAAQYEGRLGAEEATQLRTHLLNLYRTTMLRAIRPAADVLSGLDNRQILELGISFAKENNKQKQELLDKSHDEILDSRADNTVAFVEWLTGDLNDDQEAKVRNMSRRLPNVRDIYIRQRETHQGRLLALLSEHANAEKIAALMSSWILAPEAGRTPQQQHEIQTFESATDEMVAQIHGLLTARQKAHLREKISAYIKDMQSISTEKHAASGTFR